MSVTVHARSEVGGGVAAHMQCQLCGQLSRSHAHQLSHVAATHPASLDDVVFGRLGNILIYQSTAKLFHCAQCFYTCRDFTKLYNHIISKHCEVQTKEGGAEAPGEGEKADGGEDEEEKMVEKSQEKVEDLKSEDKTELIENKIETEKKMPDDVDLEIVVDKTEGGDKMGGDCKEANDVKIKAEEGNSGAADTLEDKPDIEAGDCVLMFDGLIYHCLICGFKNKMKVLGLNHVVRKHNVPRGYANRAIRRKDHSRDFEGLAAATGLSKELIQEEKAAIEKVVRCIANRYECLICSWKAKHIGFAISHVVRAHDMERPYSCQHCSRKFFLPSRLHQHIRTTHPPGRYACPFCTFKTNYMGGFRRHCSRCNARDLEGGEEEEEEEQEEAAAGAEADDEEKKETRAGRKRQRTARFIKEEEEEDQEKGAQDGNGGGEDGNGEEEWKESRRTRKRQKAVRVMDEQDG